MHLKSPPTASTDILELRSDDAASLSRPSSLVGLLLFRPCLITSYWCFVVVVLLVSAGVRFVPVGVGAVGVVCM